MKSAPPIAGEGFGAPPRAPADTAAGCRQHAADDRARALLMDTANGRARLDASASGWMSRAASIEADEDGFEARNALLRAEWLDGEDAEELAASAAAASAASTAGGGAS